MTAFGGAGTTGIDGHNRRYLIRTMADREDFHDAHLRHWQDAELLFERQRWANADQLYGLSAECGLKAVMLALRIGASPQGELTQEHWKHVNVLWPKWFTLVGGRTGSRYLQMLPPENPFDGWRLSYRYKHSRHFSRAGVIPHRSAAKKVRTMVQRAQQEIVP